MVEGQAHGGERLDQEIADSDLLPHPGDEIQTDDIPLTEELDGYTRELLGEDQVKIQPAQMGSEDFSEVMLRVPGTFFNLSLGSKAAGYTFGAHNPKVRHDEAGLPVGSAVYANIAIEWLAHNR